jgi:hypothetical protein
LLCYLHKDNYTLWRNILNKLLIEIDPVSEGTTIVISGEAWAYLATHDGLRELVTTLRENRFEAIECICYLRNRSKYAVSLYREFTRRRSNVLPFREFIARYESLLDFVMLTRSLNDIFSGNVLYRTYDEKPDIVSDFFDSIGVPYPRASVGANKGISAIDAECWRLANSRGRTMLSSSVKGLLAKQSLLLEERAFHEYTDEDMFYVDAKYTESLMTATGLNCSEVDLICDSKLKTDDAIFDIRVLSPLLAAVLDREYESIAPGK